MQIAFWSNYHGQAGVTSNTIATAIYIAMNYDFKILLTHTQYSKSNMESAFFSDSENKSSINFDDIGIDSIERLCKSGKLSSNEFSSYTKTLIDNRLDILTGSSKCKKELFEDMSNSIIKILNCANEAYDLVLVDLNSGIENDITNKVLKQSDIIIVNLSQNERVIREYFNKKELNEVLKGKKTIIALGRYDFNSKCSSKYVKKIYNYKDDIYCIPHSSEFMDSNNNHSVLNFFLSNRKVKSNSSNYLFFKEIEMLSHNILENINTDIENLEKPMEDHGILRQFKLLLGMSS